MISYYSSLKLWILPNNSTEAILRSCHWRRSAKIFECVIQNSSTKYTAASVFKVYEKHLWKSSTLVKSQNSFAGIFWLFLVQLQNKFFVEHLPVVAYVRCLKEKEWKKWNSVFLLYSGWHSSVALQGSVGEIRTNQEHFSLKNEKRN